jgi:ATP-binding protein involved in chromosome partitioning
LIDRSQITRDRVISILDAILDPKSGQGLVASGLAKGLTVAGDRAGFAMEVAVADAALYAPVRDAAEAALRAMPGMTRVSVILTAEAAPATEPKRTAGLSSAAVDQTRAKAPVPTDRPAHVRRVLAIASGKGGVGKSTVAVNLAAALSARGLSVGVLDADVYGPSLPTMLGLSGKPGYEDGAIVPHEAFGLKAMSVGLLTGAGDAMVWRGPMASQALTQMLTQTRWGTEAAPLDVLVVDLPPGTGDVQLTLIQKTPLDGAVIVSTPQEVALADARRAHTLFQKVNVPTLGLIENMSGDVFGKGGAEAEAAAPPDPLPGRSAADGRRARGRRRRNTRGGRGPARRHRPTLRRLRGSGGEGIGPLILLPLREKDRRCSPLGLLLTNSNRQDPSSDGGGAAFVGTARQMRRHGHLLPQGEKDRVRNFHFRVFKRNPNRHLVGSLPRGSPMSVDALFRPFQVKSLKLPNRIVMAPMTRVLLPERHPDLRRRRLLSPPRRGRGRPDRHRRYGRRTALGPQRPRGARSSTARPCRNGRRSWTRFTPPAA